MCVHWNHTRRLAGHVLNQALTERRSSFKAIYCWLGYQVLIVLGAVYAKGVIITSLYIFFFSSLNTFKDVVTWCCVYPIHDDILLPL